MSELRELFRALLRSYILLAFLAGGAGCTTAPSRLSLEEQPCGSWAVCTPEDALTASIEALRTNGDWLLMDCGTERVRSEALIQACYERVRKAVEKLARDPAIESIQINTLHVDVGETCLDTFIPGNEASDCAFYSYSVKLPLGWR